VDLKGSLGHTELNVAAQMRASNAPSHHRKRKACAIAVGYSSIPRGCHLVVEVEAIPDPSPGERRRDGARVLPRAPTWLTRPHPCARGPLTERLLGFPLPLEASAVSLPCFAVSPQLMLADLSLSACAGASLCSTGGGD